MYVGHTAGSNFLYSFFSNIFHMEKNIYIFPCGVLGYGLSFLCKVAITEHSRLLRYYSALSGINLFVFRKNAVPPSSG